MSLRLEMLQVARLSPQLLGDSAELVRDFLLDQLDASGGFLGRGGRPDLYYTVFGLDGLHALSAEVPSDRVAPYLRTFGDGERLDLVHLGCLARCWAALPDEDPGAATRGALAERLLAFTTPDGGYAVSKGADQGTLYGAFIALGAFQDLGFPLPDGERLTRFVADRAETARREGSADGTTPVTAALVSVLRHFGRPVPVEVVDWLEARLHHQGGFLAIPAAPMPDLLSTATALHALASAERSLARLCEPVLDYVDTLWTAKGAFHGHWADDEVDCEYTFYGLLALGHLSVWARG